MCDFEVLDAAEARAGRGAPAPVTRQAARDAPAMAAGAAAPTGARGGSRGAQRLAEAVAASAVPLRASELRAGGQSGGAACGGSADCLDALMEEIGSKRWVLLGEATHGTHEFYALRAALTRRLILEKGFTVVAVEGEWTSCFHVNRFLRKGRADDQNPGTFPSPHVSLNEVLQSFSEFPSWMWRNKETLELLKWLADFNASTPGEPVRWYGLDVQGSLRTPAEEVVKYADMLDPAFAQELRENLEPFLVCKSSAELGWRLAVREAGEQLLAAGRGDEAAPHPGKLQSTLERLLAEMQRRNRDEFAFLCPVEEALAAEQCLDVLLSGQEYYRKQYSDSGVTWNLRDQHMTSTVMRLVEHLEVYSEGPQGGAPPGIVIWAHNSHIGDARATDRGKRAGHWNLGHMVRETFGPDVTFLLGFTTHEGEVHAAPDWSWPARNYLLQAAQRGSWEAEFHDATALLQEQQDSQDEGDPVVGFLWPCGRVAAFHGVALPHRFIGVIYRPEHEQQSHISLAEISEMYDAVLHVDITTALAPL